MVSCCHMSLLTNHRESFVVGKHHPGFEDDCNTFLRKTGAVPTCGLVYRTFNRKYYQGFLMKHSDSVTKEQTEETQNKHFDLVFFTNVTKAKG